MDSQKKRILAYIGKHGSITSAEAMNALGIYRLASRINELKQEGYVFDKKTEHSRNRFGQTVYFTRYSIKEDAS